MSVERVLHSRDVAKGFGDLKAQAGRVDSGEMSAGCLGSVLDLAIEDRCGGIDPKKLFGLVMSRQPGLRELIQKGEKQLKEELMRGGLLLQSARRQSMGLSRGTCFC